MISGITTCQSNMQNSKREQWIDALRSFCIFLVVFMHIENFSIGISASESVVMQIIFTCFLTTFFFISGYVSYREQIIYTLHFTILKIKEKLFQLVIPAIAFSCMYNACFGNEIFSFLTQGFGGYWFLIVLFEIFLIFYLTSWICHHFKEKYFEIIMGIVTISIMGVPYVLPINEALSKILSIGNLTTYLPFFVIGVFSRKYLHLFKRIMYSEFLMTICILAFAIIEYIICSAHTTDMYAVYGKGGYLLQFIVKYLATFILVALFYRHSQQFTHNTTFITSLCLLGRRTLDVYLIHWFFIPTIPALYVYVKGGINPLFEILFSSIIAIMVILIAAMVGMVIRNSQWLSRYLLGTK